MCRFSHSLSRRSHALCRKSLTVIVVQRANACKTRHFSADRAVVHAVLSSECDKECEKTTTFNVRNDSLTSKQAYGAALDHLFGFSAGRSLSRALLQELKAGMEGLAPSSINVRLSAMRKLVEEARQNGMLGVEEAASLTDVPNVRQRGTRPGNWLTREQARGLLAVPDRSTLKGKRDYVILSLLVGCALRRQELAMLEVETIQLREGRWVLSDLVGKGRRVRTIAVPLWVKQGINT